ncbi:SDR family NAD(P)-dependent oxidoreductase [Frankia sp. AgKG'84/4]|uniref:SDR family NAD(P)-dependent oxidoreductase n=1 Tax=Frankia sp. AgKG'84/4 TaxID=573490 RepID=UPI0027E3DCF9|nr:SDR family oxidoreductase [Frankia sp. AgKG'84/4]
MSRVAVVTGGASGIGAATVELLTAGGAGRIVNVASTEALTAGRLTGPYTVSKHAIVGLTRSLAVDYGRVGITANCVCPGATLTGMTAAIPAEQRTAFARRNIPVGRYGRPAEIAHMIVALTAVEASFVADVAVFGMPDPEMGQYVHAVIQPAVGVEATPEFAAELRTFARDNVAHYKVPRVFDFRAELPRMATGKLAKNQLRDEYVAASRASRG